MAVIDELGFAYGERLAIEIADAVWRSIDWSQPLWRTAGVALYDRFESRIRSSARGVSVLEFASRLARKCGVKAPQIHADLLRRMNEATAEENQEATRFAHRQSGLVAAAVRALKDERKKAMQHG